MCGIAGFVSKDAPASAAVLRAVTDRLSHRGPDAYGSLLWGETALGHRRLSIIDLSTGDQPIGNEDGSVQVIFNGEIYNFEEVRAHLMARGHRFRTSSDTEVLVHLYEEYGEDMPKWLNGMFAFAIADKGRDVLFLARDRMGKKPIYYTDSTPGLRFAFASEMKAFYELPGFEPKLDPEAVADFLALSYVPDPRSILKNVRKLPPAHWMKVSRQGIKLGRYWRPPFERRDVDELDAIDEIRDLAADAVKGRMISDVPLGAFLSGGVDSSAVVGFMSALSERVKTFSIAFDEEDFDESRHAMLSAQLNRTEHHSETVKPDVVEMLEVLAQHFDEPFGDSSAIPTLYLCRMARQHVTVALSGDGADEVFGGYRRYRYGVLEETIRRWMPRLMRRPVFGLAGRLYPKFDYLPQVFRAKTMLSNLAQDIGAAYFTSMSVFRDAALEAVLSPDLRRSLGGYSPRADFEGRFQQVRELDPLEQLQSVDYDTYLPGDILVKVDRASMAYSLEARSPWLDYRLVELAGSLPPAYKLRGGDGKYIFKRAMSLYVARPLLERAKKGFSMPLAQWFRTSLRPVFERGVLEGGLEEYISRREASRLFEEHQSGLHDHSRKLWNLMVLAAWNERYAHAPAGETVFGETVRQ